MELQNQVPLWAQLALLAWTLPWKGYALWKAAKHDHKNWFIAILILQTFAILDILYIFIFSKKENIGTRLSDRIKAVFKKNNGIQKESTLNRESDSQGEDTHL